MIFEPEPAGELMHERFSEQFVLCTCNAECPQLLLFLGFV